MVIDAFYVEAIKEMSACVSMTEEELREEYRRAGKLHKFDPLTELEKRYARVGKKYQLPDDFIDLELEEHFKLIEDED